MFRGSRCLTIFVTTILWEDRGPRKAIPKGLPVKELVDLHLTRRRNRSVTLIDNESEPKVFESFEHGIIAALTLPFKQRLQFLARGNQYRSFATGYLPG